MTLQSIMIDYNKILRGHRTLNKKELQFLKGELRQASEMIANTRQYQKQRMYDDDINYTNLRSFELTRTSIQRILEKHK